MNISLSPEQAAEEGMILQLLNKKKLLGQKEIKSFKIIRRSIDARQKQIKINLGLLISDEGEITLQPHLREYHPVSKDAGQVVIVGAGPAGLFAALKAIEKGLKPIVVERGKSVDQRRIDIAEISREGKINPDSNYCFGEGGAGAFSDGKLYTRSKKRGNIREVLEILHQFGASEEILISAHPHIGSDKLPGIIKSIRNKINECGGEVRFETTMKSLLLEGNKAKGIETESGEKIYGPVFLATGHSARDTMRMLHSLGVAMEPKGIAMGVRLEHPQHLIDRMQYHSKEGRGKYLPPAEYSFVNQSEGRGVYTFCMCPGGVIVPAVSGERQIVVNGMSASARSGKWANSGYVIEIHPGDLEVSQNKGPLEMLEVQEFFEKKFADNSKGTLNAPAQRIDDFIKGKESKTLPQTSYAPGIHPADFRELFPDTIAGRLKSGLEQIKKKCPEFVSNEGMMIGLESRTSSPVRIPRDSESFCHIEIEDLYPVGEGAGYAGGIVSSAVDGINCIDAYSKKISG